MAVQFTNYRCTARIDPGREDGGGEGSVTLTHEEKGSKKCAAGHSGQRKEWPLHFESRSKYARMY